jgi:hypothetical protein
MNFITNAGRLVPVAAAVLAGLVGCRSRGPERELIKKRDAIEKAAKPYSADWFARTKDRHVVIAFDVRQGRLVPTARGAELRVGRQPFHPRKEGDVTVRYLDATGKVIGRYAIDDPLEVKSCDLDVSPTGGIKRLDSGIVEVLVPYDRAIARVELVRGKEPPLSLDVVEMMKSLRLPSK